MAERAIGLARHARQVGIRNEAADERLDDLHCDLGVGPAEEARDRLRGEARPCLGHVKPAVAGKPRKGHVDEAERRGVAAGGYVKHGRYLRLAPTLEARPGFHKEWVNALIWLKI